MLLEGLIDFFLGVLKNILEFFSISDLTFDMSVIEILSDFFSLIVFLLPIDTVLFIFGAYIAIQGLKITISLIRFVAQFIPFL